jgi:glycosyltransferase involved in cell wall biosynthesis
MAIFGPTFPFKGGIAQHTTDLAHRLAADGHEVVIENWRAQYPKRLYPGQLELDRPEMPVFPSVVRRLAWYAPWTWVGAGRRRRGVDVAVFVVTTPPQLLAYLAVSVALGRHVRRVAVAHNVVPHEPRPGDRWLVRTFLRRMDRVVVHSDSERRSAEALGLRTAVQRRLPPTLGPGWSPATDRPATHRLLYFGFVRAYKGLDVLIEALAGLPDAIRLRVVGEDWGLGDELRQQIRVAGLDERVELRLEYVPADEVASVFVDSDALVLPYRSGTGSQVPRLAHHHGVPVVATRVGDLAEQVHDGVDGLLCEPGDVEGLRQSLASLYQDDLLTLLRLGVQPPDIDGPWRDYLDAVTDAPTSP